MPARLQNHRKPLLLWRAIALSALLHALIVFGGLIHLPIDNTPPASISVTLKTIAPPPPAAPQKPDTPRKPKATTEQKQPAPIKNQTGTPATTGAPTAKPDAAPPAAEPPPDTSPAQLIEAAGTPDYPPDAQQKGLDRRAHV